MLFRITQPNPSLYTQEKALRTREDIHVQIGHDLSPIAAFSYILKRSTSHIYKAGHT